MKQVKYVPEKEVPSEYLVRAGDLVFNNTNSEELVGKTAIFRLPIKVTLSNHMTRIRLNTKVALPEYVWFTFNRLFRQGVFAGMCKRWVNQAAVDTTQLSHLRIPVAGIKDQEKFASITAKMETIMQAQSRSRQEISELFRSVMLKAFSGDPTLKDSSVKARQIL
jgi:type I restriction enzyme S subunit